MKRYLFFSAAAYLVSIAAVSGQEVYDVPAAAGGYLQTPYGPATGQGGCQADCQVSWGMYRNGALWDNYCAEKRPCYDPLARRAIRCLDDCNEPVALSAPTRCAPTCGRGVLAIRSSCRRDRILSLNIFCELLGWRDCRCCTGSCCDRDRCQGADDAHAHESPHREPSPELDETPWPPLPPDPVPSDADQAESDRPVETTPPDDGADDPERPALPGVDVPGLEDPAPEGPTPAVPRNKLPQAKPVSAPSSRRSAIKVLVAERLSDYIKT